MTTSGVAAEPLEQRLNGAELAAAHAQLTGLRRRAHRGLLVETLGVLALLLVAYAVPTLLTDKSLRLEWAYRCILLASFVFIVLRTVHRRYLQPKHVELGSDEMALAVERRAPGVKQALISSLQFDRELAAGVEGIESAALKAAVVADVRARLGAIPFAAAIDTARIRRFGAGLAAGVAFFVGWGIVDAASLSLWARRNLVLSDVDWPRYTTLSLADASAIRLPQGDPLTLRALVDGPVPDQAFVDYVFATGERGSEPMSRTGDREFTWTIDAVVSDLQIAMQAGDALPITAAVTVVERPRIDDLVVQVTFPDYMGREPWLVPATEGELRLPRGARLDIGGKSQKPLVEAFVLFGSDQKTALRCGTDQRTFAGAFSPANSGVLVVDVIDTDRLGAGAPPKLVLRVGDDKPPTLEFRLRGIGTSITTHARIPGDLKVKDDFGLTAVAAAFRATADQVAAGAETPLPEVPFASADVVFGAPLLHNALRHETTGMVDLAQWNRIPDEAATGNPIRPGMLFSLRFSAHDNFGPEPHAGFTEVMTFRVVTRDKLVEELRRRQVEQRQELERILQEEQTATMELAEMVNPTAAGERKRQAETRLKALARQQQALGRRVAFVGDAYQRILWEYENNRLIEANKVRQLESLIPEPLADLAKEAFPATSRQVGAFTDSGIEATRAEAVDGYRRIQERIRAILKHMEEAENLAALLEELRQVIKVEDEAIRGVRRRVEDRERDVFGPGNPRPKNGQPQDPDKKR